MKSFISMPLKAQDLVNVSERGFRFGLLNIGAANLPQHFQFGSALKAFTRALHLKSETYNLCLKIITSH